MNATKGDDLENVIIRGSSSITDWSQRRNFYIVSLAVKCITGHMLGVENRYLRNIMMVSETAKVYNVCFGECFYAQHIKLPFRLTRIMQKALDATGVKGSLRRHMCKALNAVTSNRDMLLDVLEASIFDDQLKWTNSKKKSLSHVKSVLYLDGSDMDYVDRLIESATKTENIASMSTEWNPWW